MVARYVERLLTGCQIRSSQCRDGPTTETKTESPFATIEEAIEDIRRGRMVVVCDDENRENEGDLTMAAQFATPEAVNFMAKHGAGPDLPGAHRRALRRARPQPDGGQERGAAPDRLHGLGRGPRGRDHRDLGGRPRPHHPGRDRPALAARATWSSPATSSRSRPRTAACSSAPARPRRPSTSPGSPA